MKREVKIGLLVLISGIILYLGFNFLKGKDFFTSDQTYYAVYDNVEGLTISNIIQLNGFQIGRVDQIKILHDKKDSLLVVMQIQRDVKLASGAIALLTDDGLLGGKKIVIQNEGDITKPLQSEAYLKIKRSEGLTDMMSKKVDPVLTNVNATIENLNDLLDKEAKNSLQKSFAHLETTMKNFEASSLVLNKLMLANQTKITSVVQNVDALSSNLNQTVTDFQPLLKSLNTFADTLNDLELQQTLTNLNQVVNNLNSVVAKIDSGDGSLAKLINQDELHKNLNQTVNDLDELFLDMKARPKRYIHFSVFGRKDKDESKKEETK